MAQSHPDAEECAENEKGTVTMHENGSTPVDYNSDNATQDPFRRYGIDEKHEKRILRKLDIHLLPFVSLLYLLSFL
jgi:hypothetical protein